MKINTSLVAALVALPVVASSAQRPAPSGTFRTLANFTIESPAPDPHVSADGRFVLLGRGSQLQVYEVATKRTTTLAEGRGIDWLEWSRRGDRVAWTQLGDDGRTNYVWTMPVDPKTATPTGPAQRVTVGQSQQPSISQDGRWLAFGAPDSLGASSHLGLRGAHLSVVPITGGPERVIAHFKGGFEVARWSADDKAIYVGGTVVGERDAVVSKVYVDGRRPEAVRTGSAEWFTGMTADRRHLVLVPATTRVGAADRAIVIDTTGREIGRVPLPEGTVTQYDDVLGDSALVWVTLTRRTAIEIASLRGGRPQRLPLVGESSDVPVWSPDGKHVAFQVRENRRIVLAVMNADGSNVRVFRQTPVREDQRAMRWSPDSRYVAFITRDVRLTLLDVAGNTFRTVTTDTTLRVGNWTWGTDSRSIVAVMLRAPGTRVSIDRISLTGAHTKVVDGAAIPGRNPVHFVRDTAVYVLTDSASFLISLRGGPARNLGGLRANTFTRFPVVSLDHQSVVSQLVDARRPDVHQFEVKSLVTGERRQIEVPFRPALVDARFTPDGRSIVALGWSTTDSTGLRLYVVPLNGGTPRAVTTTNDPVTAGFSIAPDGSSVAFPSLEDQTTSLLLVDLRSALARRSATSASP